MSLWNVEQKASVQLVESFFKHRKAGKNKLEALRLARTEIRNNGYDHPFFWAPFILVGNLLGLRALSNKILSRCRSFDLSEVDRTTNLKFFVRRLYCCE